jgi:hypothetical protein
MTTIDDLRKRLDAVERAVSDGGDADLTALADAVKTTEQLRRVSTQVDDLDERVAELESATQAIRGYVGSIRAVNERVERRANRALAAVDDPPPVPTDGDAPPDEGDATAGPSAAVGRTADAARPRDLGGVAAAEAVRSGEGGETDSGTKSPLVERLRDAL